MVLLIIPLLWIATAAGRRINVLIAPKSAQLGALERSCFGLATGLFVLAHLVLLLGLLGLFTTRAIFAMIAVYALVGWAEHAIMAREAAGASLRQHPRSATLCCGLACFFFAATSFASCFLPPTGLEWDSLSYHLADPQIYLNAHKVIYLPWESHSNFAFLLEMLYAIGLSVHSIALAKLFHWTFGLLGGIAVYLLTKRASGSGLAACVAAVLYASTPLIVWEAGTSYVDLAPGAFLTLALLALTRSRDEGMRSNIALDARFAALAGLMLAGMLSVKATSLVTIALLCGGLILWGIMSQQGRIAAARAALLGTVSIGLGSAFYLKSWIYTGNPFFPFAYSVFGGRYWNRDLGAAYTASQNAFGVGHDAYSFLTAPWNVTLSLLHGREHAFNDVYSPFITIGPCFLAAALSLSAMGGRPPQTIRLLAGYMIGVFGTWFILTQQVRYLMPALPVMAALTGWLTAFLFTSGRAAGKALIALSVLNVLFCGYVSAFVLIAGWPAIAGGEGERNSYIQRGLESYGAMQYINSSAPPNAGVVTYGEPRDFYIDRPYMWGDPGHSTFIPYDRLGTAESLSTWFAAHRIRYVLVNLRYFPLKPGTGWIGALYDITAGRARPPAYYANGVAVFDLGQ